MEEEVSRHANKTLRMPGALHVQINKCTTLNINIIVHITFTWNVTLCLLYVNQGQCDRSQLGEEILDS